MTINGKTAKHTKIACKFVLLFYRINRLETSKPASVNYYSFIVSLLFFWK